MVHPPGRIGWRPESNSDTKQDNCALKGRKEDSMQNGFMRVDDVASELGVSKSYAYKIVKRLNDELKEMGYLTISGRISKKYFMEKLCYNGSEKMERKG